MTFNKKASVFFSGKLYPLVMTALMLVGYVFEIEAYTATLNMLIVSFALLISPSIKPLMFFVLTFFYQMTPANSPMDPSKSDNYFTGGRQYLLLLGAASFIVCVIIYTFKNKYYTKNNFLKMPLFKPMMLLTAGLLANGFMKSDYAVGNLLWALALVVVYVALFGMLWIALKDEDPHEITEYFTYINLIISWFLLIQVAGIYLSGNLFVNGGVNRGAFTLGFGKTNAVGFVLASLIPMNFYGFMKNRSKWMPYLHLFTAFALLGASITSTSRNAVLIGCAYFAFCFIFMMFAGDKKKIARILVPVSAAVVILAVLIFFKDQFFSLIKHYIDRTDMDNGLNGASAGRINIWLKAFEIFKENPIFGAGFYGEEMRFAQPMAAIIPHFAHNTVFQLLASMGAFGTLCYVFYRICTLKYIFRKPTLDRFMLMVSASTLLTGSMLDNHLFNIYPGLYYTTTLVIAVLLYEKQFSKKDEISAAPQEEKDDTDSEDDEKHDDAQFIENISEMLKESSEILNS